MCRSGQREDSHGATRDGINTAQLLNLLVALPPLPEQRRIVAAIEQQLTRLDAGVASLKRAQAGLRRYKAAVLKAACEGRLVPQDSSDEPADALLRRILDERRAKWEAEQIARMQAQGRMILDDGWQQKYQEPQGPDMTGLPELPAGWVWTSIEQYSCRVTSGSRGWAQYYSDTGSLFVRVGNFNRLDTSIDLRDIVFVNEPNNAETDRTRLQINDLLITITADVGMVGVIDERALQWGKAFINQHVALVRPVLTKLVVFTSLALASEPLQTQIRNKQYGLTKTGLGLEDVKALVIPLPPLTEQRRIVAEVERRLSVVAEVEAAVAANLKRAERLRQSILKRAFEGKLVPQNPSDEPASVLLERIRREREGRDDKKGTRQLRIEGM
jgi:type I restriction enzyme, S subunit